MATDTTAQPPATCPRCGSFLPQGTAECPICGWDLSSTGPVPVLPGPAEELEIVRRALAAEYEVIQELGRGGMAIVYRAREIALARDVAIKVLPFTRVGDAAFVERFQREARTAAQLEHPHIIPIHRVGQVGSVIYFAMKYLHGPSLADVLRRQGKLSPAELRRLLVHVADALDYASKRGVVHRDIKPDNILLDETGRYVVTDFGIAKASGASQLTETGMSVGTPRYMSPEQASGRPLDGRSDIYCLGIVAYHGLTGQPPFEAGDHLAVMYAHVNTPVPRPALSTVEEQELFVIIERMVAKDPAARFQSGAELIAALGGGPAVLRRSTPSAVSPVEPTVPIAPAGAQVLPRELVAAGLQWARAKGPRFWAPALGGGIAGAMLLYLLQASGGAAARCREALAASSDSFTVLLDPIGTVRESAPVELWYEVCGLEGGVAFKARVTVTRVEGSGGVVGGVRRLFGGSPRPIAVSFDDETDGFGTRRGRSVELGDPAPGSYRLALTVTDPRGLRRSRSHEFVVIER